MARFLDTNILVRYFTNDEPEMARAALALMEKIERGEERVVTSPIVIFETVFLLERHYKVPKAAIREKVGDVLALRSLHLPEKTLCLQALDLYVEKNIAFADAYHAIWMQARGVTDIYSFDREFDRIAGLHRIDPRTQQE